MTTLQPTQKLVVDLLQAESRVAIAWFTLNQMLANPEKFQAIFINCAANDIEIKNRRNQIIFGRPRKTDRDQFGLKIKLRNSYLANMFKSRKSLRCRLLKRLSPYINCKDRMAICRCFILCHFKLCSVVGL